jgi:hypothetical protein
MAFMTRRHGFARPVLCWLLRWLEEIRPTRPPAKNDTANIGGIAAFTIALSNPLGAGINLLVKTLKAS